MSAISVKADINLGAVYVGFLLHVVLTGVLFPFKIQLVEPHLVSIR